MIHLQHTSRQAKGVVVVTDDSGEHQYETMCCVHCRVHWRIQPGSGKKRGFCYKCGGPTCGQHKCDTCVDYMKG